MRTSNETQKRGAVLRGFFLHDRINYIQNKRKDMDYHIPYLQPASLQLKRREQKDSFQEYNGTQMCVQKMVSKRWSEENRPEV